MTRVDQGPPLEKDFFVRFYFERERTRKGFKYRCAWPTPFSCCFRLTRLAACSVSKMSEEAASEAGAEAAAAAAT